MFDPLKPGYLYVASWQNRERPFSPARRWIAGIVAVLTVLSVLTAFALVFATVAALTLVVGAVATVAVMLQRMLGRRQPELPESSPGDLADQQWETIDVTHMPSR